MNAQEIVAANVAARGYANGWTAEQFVARQLCKMTEELGEASDQIVSTASVSPISRNVLWWIDKLGDAERRARIAFDNPADWCNFKFSDPDALRSELADMQVVLFAAAEALGFDVVQAAIEKSSKDVERGVR